MKLNKTIKYQSFFIYLLPIFIVTGPFLSDSVVTISSIFFLFCVFKNNLYKYFNNLFFKLFIVFWIYITFNSLFAENIFFSLKSSLFYLRFGIFSILIFYLIDTNHNFLKNFSKSLFLTFSVVLIDSYFQYFVGHNIFGFVSPQPNRLSSFFGDEMIVGSFLSRLFPMVMAFGILMTGKGIKYLGILCFSFLILTDVIIFLSGERTSFGLLIITNLIYILFINKFKLFRIIGFIISLMIIFLLVMNDEMVKDRMIDQTIKEIVIDSDKFERGLEGFEPTSIKFNNIFTPVHQSHYLTALNMFYRDKLFGVGPNMFRYECSKIIYSEGDYNCTTHPHNIHIQILAETGIIGYLLFLIPLIYISIYFIKSLFLNYKIKTILKDYQICLCITFLLTLFPFAPSGNFFNNWLSIVFFLPVGFYLHAILRKDEY